MEEQTLEVPGVGEVRCFRAGHGEASASKVGAFVFIPSHGHWFRVYPGRTYGHELTKIALAAHLELAAEFP